MPLLRVEGSPSAAGARGNLWVCQSETHRKRHETIRHRPDVNAICINIKSDCDLTITPDVGMTPARGACRDARPSLGRKR
jgi:hypothetical protein